MIRLQSSIHRALLAGASLVMFVSASWAPLFAEGGPRVHALVDARVVTGPGTSLDRATVVVRDGVITQVGTAIEVPPDARVTDAAGLTLYPGLVEPYLPREWPEGDEDEERSTAGHPNPLVNPERDALRIEEETQVTERLRSAGFGAALVVPDDGAWRGTGVLVQLADGELRDRVLRRDVTQAASFATRGGYPSSLMGAVALFRQSVLDARWYAAAHAAYELDRTQARPPLDTALEALQPVVRGERPVLFESRDALDVLRFARIADQLDLRAWVVGNGDEYRYLDAVAAAGLPLLLPLDLPSAPDVEEDSDNLDVSLEELVHWKKAPENPALLADAGVRFALTSHGLADPSDLFGHLARAVEAGLSEEAALAALTTVPAELLGVDDRLGTIEPGRIGNLILVEGSLFVDKPKLRAVWVDGDRYELSDTAPPTVDPVGTWTLDIDAGGQQMEGDLVLEGTVDALSGSVTMMGNSLPVSDASVSGATLTVTIDTSSFGMAGEIVFTLEIEGDRASGSADSPMGAATVKARRTGPGGASGSASGSASARDASALAGGGGGR